MTEREERQQHVTQPTVKLWPFWPQAPALWFAQAERSFTVKKIEAQFDRYCHVVAALQQDCAEGDFVAAVRAGDRQRGGGSRGHGRSGGRRRGGRGSGHPTSSVEEPEASKEARLAAGLCIKHWRYGELASSCTAPCSWQGNGGAGGN
jgi:hypothetical protein